MSIHDPLNWPQYVSVWLLSIFWCSRAIQKSFDWNTNNVLVFLHYEQVLCGEVSLTGFHPILSRVLTVG